MDFGIFTACRPTFRPNQLKKKTPETVETELLIQIRKIKALGRGAVNTRKSTKNENTRK